MKNEKRSIFYVDDQQGYLTRLNVRHGTKFEITEFKDPAELFKKLKETKHLPDLVLLDLYYPPEGRTEEVQQEKEKDAKRELREFNKGIATLKKIVDDTWEPKGLFWLSEIRKRFTKKRLPILVYTQRGLLLLEDSQLAKIEENDADWLLKDPLQEEEEDAAPLIRTTETTEACRIAKFIDICHESRNQRISKIKIAIISALFGALISCFLDWIILFLRAFF